MMSTGDPAGIIIRGAARGAMDALRREHGQTGHRLALTLMFEPPSVQFLCASVFELVITLETALLTPSESLLAAIRVQWWADALAPETKSAETAAHPVPVRLVAQLHKLCRLYWGFDRHLIDLIGHWQNACYQEDRNSSAGWRAAWRILAAHGGWGKFTADAEMVANQHYAISRHAATDGNHENSDRLKALNGHKRGSGASWLYLNAALSTYLVQAKRDSETPMLVWHVLKWHCLGPPSPA